MLRITRQDTNGDNGITLRLEGRLLGPWVEALRQESLAAAATGPIRLDLSAVGFLDAAGVEAIRSLLAAGATLQGCSSFARELLLTDPEKDQGNGLHD